ncbi:hypothetical protein [Fontivita pretiosa]|uniref:hypothetical protein n=1 Tax=Fontivita pretiosa TaxID=2989684 RepID=UPI003D166BBE
MRLLLRLMATTILCAAVGGCAREINPFPTKAESDSLSDIAQLTFGFSRAGEAYFSPDMKWLILQAIPEGQQHYQMYVAPVKYGQRTAQTSTVAPQEIVGLGSPIRISPPNSRNTCGYFSPDGNSLIFSSTAGKEDPTEPPAGYQRQGRDYRWSFPAGMEIYRADGWQGAVAAAEPNAIVDLARHRLTDNDAYDAEASYSPDGKWLVFSSNRTGDLELFAMRADGSGLVQLTFSRGYDGGPFFSPDGRRIVYRSDRKGNDLLQVFVADVVFSADGAIRGIANEKQLTRDQHVNWGPYWHPDGRHIVYATSAHGHDNYEIYLMRADGSRKTRITHTPPGVPDVLPVISPDGRYLVWSSRRDGRTTQVYLARFRLPRGS